MINKSLAAVLASPPHAVAVITGNDEYPQLHGVLALYQTTLGVIASAEVEGLPSVDSPCGEGIFGFHIHSGESCGGSEDSPFSEALAHYDKDGCPHPEHTGDLPPLFGNGGTAISVFLTDRFTVSEVIGKAVIIHGSPDDFKSQPAGDSGKRIACGIIKRI